MDDLSPAAARRLKLLTRTILAVGFGAAIVVYVTAGARPEDPLSDQRNSKKYLHDLEVYGGKANVLAAEFREWFAGLWYGKNLAVTIAVLTVLTVPVVRFLAIPLPSPFDDEEPDEKPSGPRRL
jgi:hypothetical protein